MSRFYADNDNIFFIRVAFVILMFKEGCLEDFKKAGAEVLLLKNLNLNLISFPKQKKIKNHIKQIFRG